MKKLVYVGDFGHTPITDQTLKAYSVEFLKGEGKLWRRSSKNRENVERMYADLAVVQRYFWVRDEDREGL